MADDLAAMKTRVIFELGRRTDLAGPVASAITDAIRVYQKTRFRFNETVPSAPISFNTVVGQDVYGLAANANIATLFAIDALMLAIGNDLYELSQDSPTRLKLYNQVNTMAGQPLWYGYEGNEIILSPVPSGVWPITMSLFRRAPEPASDNEVGNPWMIDGERLIRARAKFEIATHVTRNDKMAQAMSPSPPGENNGVVGAAWREYKSLKGEGNRVTSLGRIRSMQF